MLSTVCQDLLDVIPRVMVVIGRTVPLDNLTSAAHDARETKVEEVCIGEAGLSPYTARVLIVQDHRWLRKQSLQRGSCCHA
jgi:hypothetical protein